MNKRPDVLIELVLQALQRTRRYLGDRTLEQYLASAELRGAYFTGSPQQVIEKILFQHEIFGHERFLVKFTTGPVPHRQVLRSIELLGTVVAPAVRAEVARRQAGTGEA